MSAKSYNMLMKLIAIVLAAFIALSIIQELPIYVPASGIMVALVVANIARRRVKETISDERNRRIDEKATALSYRIYTMVTAAFVLVVLMLRSSLPSWVGIAGESLAYSLCALMLVHLASFKYYSQKL